MIYFLKLHVLNHINHIDFIYCEPKGFTILKRVYKVKNKTYIYIVLRTFFPIRCEISQSTLLHLCRYNILIVSHKIAGPNKLSNWGRVLTLIPFIITCPQLYIYFLFWAQGTLMILKHVYKIKRSSYIYNAKILKHIIYL